MRLLSPPLLSAAVGLLALPVVAETHTVENTDDDSVGSLRQAIADAVDGDTIEFDPALSGATIRLESGTLHITEAITIDASPLSGGITISPDSPDSPASPLVRISSSSADLPVVLDSLTITGGRGTKGQAGGMGSSAGGIRINSSSVAIRRCSVIDNRAGDGGDESDSAELAGMGGGGGGIYISYSTVVIEDSLIADNATGAGGRHFGDRKDGGSGDGGGLYCYQSTVTIRDSTVRDNRTPDGGLGGATGEGGGIHSYFSDTLVERSTISGNATGKGGDGNGLEGMDSISAGPSGHGGGIRSSQAGLLTVRNSTISGNRTGDAGTNGDLNSGFAGYGGAIRFNGCDIDLEGVTIVGNSSGSSPIGEPNGGIAGYAGGLTIENSIIAANFDQDDAGTPRDIDVSDSTVLRSGVNLIGNHDTVDAEFPLPTTPGEPNANGDFVGDGMDPLDPLLGPLQDNGGPTLTHLPLPGSPAYDPPGGDTFSTLATDQRGVARIIGDSQDIGAVEAPDYIAIAAARAAAIAAHAAARAATMQKLRKKIRKAKKKLRRAKRLGKKAKAKRLKKKQRKFKKRLRRL